MVWTKELKDGVRVVLGICIWHDAGGRLPLVSITSLRRTQWQPSTDLEFATVLRVEVVAFRLTRGRHYE